MTTTYNQSFDADPGEWLPSDWKGDAMMIRSPPNSGRSNTWSLSTGLSDPFPWAIFANYDVADPSGGAAFDASVYVSMNPNAVAGRFDVGLAALCGDSPITHSSSCLWFGVRFNGTAGSLVVLKITAGTESVVQSIANTDSRLVTGEYYKIRVVRDVGGLFDVELTRDSDGWMMDSSGAFVNAAATAVTGLSVSSPPSGSYYGVGMYSDSMVPLMNADDFSVTTEWPVPMVAPRGPLVVPVPLQYYRPD